MATNATSTTQWASFLDLVEVTEYLEFTTAPQVTQQGMLQRFIDAACVRAQQLADRPFCPTEFTERHDGWSGEYIMVRYTPFLQLVLCREWQSTGGFVTLPESTPENNSFDGVQIDYATGRFMRTFAGYSWPRPFFPGSRNIEITYKAGYNPVPPDVWQAACDLVAYWWRNTQQASRSFTTGSGEYGGPDNLWPGVPNRIAEVFANYRLPAIG